MRHSGRTQLPAVSSCRCHQLLIAPRLASPPAQPQVEAARQKELTHLLQFFAERRGGGQTPLPPSALALQQSPGAGGGGYYLPGGGFETTTNPLAGALSPLHRIICRRKDHKGATPRK